MKEQKTDFSQGRVASHILRIGLPILAAEFVHVLYNLVDRMYIGHMEGTGTAALTGVGIVFPLITLISALSSLFGTGGSTLSAIARGAGDKEKATAITETSFTLLLASGAVTAVLMCIFAPNLIALLGGDEETLPYALSYFRIYVAGTIPVLISLGMNPFINSMGYARTGMVTVMLGAALNIALDPLLIYTLKLGVAGAAIATVVSQTASAVWVLLFLCGKKPVIRISRLRVDREETKSILKLGITGFAFRVTNSVTQAACNITLKTWAGEQSTLYVGAMSVINSVREVVSLPSLAFMSAATPVLSFNYGAKKYSRVSDSIRTALFMIGAINVTVWCVLAILYKPIIGIFTSDAELLRITVPCLFAYFICFPVMTFQNVGQQTFVGLNYPKHALFFSLLRKIILILPLTLLLPGWGLGVMGPFWAEPISEVVGAAATFTTMYFTVWRRMKRTPDGT